jgi:hypothetical protein
MPRLWWVIAIACLVPVGAQAGQEPPAPPPPAVVEPLSPPGAEAPAVTAPRLPAPEPPAVPALEPLSVPAPEPQVLDPNAKAKTEITIDKDTQVAVGIGFGGPIGAAGSFRVLHGLGADVRAEDGRVKAVCAIPIPHCAQGFLFQADAGSGGGKLSLGIGARAHVDEEDFRGTVGVSLRASLARTWGSPIGTEPNLTYLGPELDLSVLRFNLTLGVLWRVSGHAGASAVFGWGIGFGL